MKTQKTMSTHHLYDIRVASHLSTNWAAHFEGLSIRHEPEGETVLSGSLDQAALHGVLMRIRNLGLNLISINRVEATEASCPDAENDHIQTNGDMKNDRQNIGQILFWLGIIGVIVMQVLTRIQSPTHRVHTAEELSGTTHAIWGALFWIRNMGANGLMLSLMGVLLATGKKGSYFWLLGFLPLSASGLGVLWQPSQHIPALFGIGGTVILLSYFGILWSWTQTHSAYEGAARTGKQIQLLGYSFLVTTGLLLCMYFGNPKQPALADLAIPSGESINLTLSLSMLLLFVGHYLVARSSMGANPSS